MPCSHPTIYPDGNCTLCGVLATTVPGLAAGHRMIARPRPQNPYGVQAADGSVEEFPSLSVAMMLSGKTGIVVVKQGKVWGLWSPASQPW